MPRPRPKPNSTPDDIAFGINTCAMALEYGFARSLLYWREAKNERISALVEKAKRSGIQADAAELVRMDELTGGGVHQGILVRLRDVPGKNLDEVYNNGQERSLIIVLDRITDPQNLGAVLRTAVAVGADAIVVPPRRGVQLTPGVHRASSGLSFLAPVAAPQNLSQAIREMKEHGYWIVAAEAGPGSTPATTFDWPSKTALILGSEGEGIAHMLLEHSDFRVSLPMDPRVDSLNVGVACGALSYLWRRQWPAPETTAPLRPAVHLGPDLFGV